MTTSPGRRLAASSIFVALAVLCLLVPANGVAAQQNSVPRRIGAVTVGYAPNSQELQVFSQALREAGYVDGRDVTIEWRFASADHDRVNTLVADLVARKVDVLLVESTAAALAAKRATQSIPIVMAYVADPVGSGIVGSLARPGGNITGLSNMTVDLAVKRLQLLKEAVPRAKKIGVLWNPDTPWHQRALEKLEGAAPALGVQLEIVAVQAPAEFNPAFATLTRAKVDALLLVDGPFTGIHGPALMRLAMAARLPVAYSHRHLVEKGALISYAPDAKDMFRRAAGYVDKILRGAKPADLPIEQPTKFEFVVNLKTAKTLGIAIPQSILIRADEVIR